MKRKIVITKRSDDYHACLKGKPCIWGCGKTVVEAIGQLMLAHPEIFGLEIKQDSTTVKRPVRESGYEDVDLCPFPFGLGFDYFYDGLK